MSRRKKKPAYNPRKDARDFVKAMMQSVLKKQAVFIESTEFLSGRIDREREVTEAITHEELKAFTLKALDEAQAAFLGMCLQGKELFGKLIVEADAKAVPVFDMLNDNSKTWKEIKDQFHVDHTELSLIDQRANMLAMDIQGTSIEIFSTYNAKVKFVKQALNNGHIVEQAEVLLAEALANNSKELPKNAIVDHNDVVVETEEAANV
ncbi:hypothetical protein G7554_000217 [Salmonella enterica subsp. enterica serovar Saintpaul]|nr:hypothetical protein [Salmonella enterica subsp. enterica serovar Saintpaul]